MGIEADSYYSLSFIVIDMETSSRILMPATEARSPHVSPPDDLKQVFKEWKKFRDGSPLQESKSVILQSFLDYIK